MTHIPQAESAQLFKNIFFLLCIKYDVLINKYNFRSLYRKPNFKFISSDQTHKKWSEGLVLLAKQKVK